MRRSVIAVTAVLFAAVACSESITGPPALLESLPRPLSTGEEQVIASSNAFAFDLFRSVSASSENTFIAPFSVSMALGMTMNGSAGATLDSMRTTLGFGAMPLAEINASFSSVLTLLQGLDSRTKFRIGNAVWFRHDFSISPTFISTVSDAFDARVAGLDFDAPSSVTTINDWASDATNGRIPKVVESLDPGLMVLIANAIYFDGKWRSQFDPDATQNLPFTSQSGAVTSVPTMSQEASVRVISTARLTAADLPYGNGAFTMTVMLPKPGLSADSLARTMTESEWDAIAEALDDATEGKIFLALPRFELKYRRSLKNDLAALGMANAFVPGADFGPMTTDGDGLIITDVDHQTFVRTDESGTEAAAVTTVHLGVTSAPPSFIVNRPFLFVIRERFSGAVLFMGRMNSIPTT